MWVCKEGEIWGKEKRGVRIPVRIWQGYKGQNEHSAGLGVATEEV